MERSKMLFLVIMGLLIAVFDFGSVYLFAKWNMDATNTMYMFSLAFSFIWLLIVITVYRSEKREIE